MSIDDIYRSRPADKFTFDARVASVFDDMISRSVPGYAEVVELTCAVAGRLAQPGSAIYDLGCSTGTVLISLARELQARYPDDSPVRLVGVDSSEPMLEACRERLNRYVFGERVELRLGTVEDSALEGAGVVVLNYTLQFMPPDRRLPLLKRIAEALPVGGALILAEKIRFESAVLHELVDDLHVAFKRRNNYTDLEIARKREALEGVLIPLTCGENLELLKEAGFAAAPVGQSLNFVTFVGVKES